MKISVIAFCIVILGLMGCAGNSVKNSCVNADWYGLGLFDGTNGEPAEKSTERVKECKAHGVELDVAKYTEGYVAGVQKYCTYEGGKKAGERGRLYKQGTCPLSLSDDFIRGYQEGREEYEAGRALNRTGRY